MGLQFDGYYDLSVHQTGLRNNEYEIYDAPTRSWAFFCST
jgi:hypothetical protein